MINSPIPDRDELTRTMSNRIIDSLAEAIIADDDSKAYPLDLTDLPALRDLLTDRAYLRLCIAIDCCPYHDCDLETCDDDSLTCRERLESELD
jgi:hypothetical protein